MGHYPLGPVAIKSACLFSVVNPGPKLSQRARIDHSKSKQAISSRRRKTRVIKVVNTGDIFLKKL